MTTSMAASHAASKRLKDAIFGASAACREAAEKYGADKVTNATMGVMMDENGKFASIPTMERVFRSLSIEDYARYAPIPGLPDYLDAVIDLTFADRSRRATSVPSRRRAARAPSTTPWPTTQSAAMRS